MPIGLGLLLIGGILYLAYNTGTFASFGGAPAGLVPPTPATPFANPGGLSPNTQFTTPQTAPRGAVSTISPSAGLPIPASASIAIPTQTTGVSKVQLAIGAASTVGAAALTAPATFAALGLTGAAAGAATAGIGAVAAIAAALYAAHLARAKQAKDENSAMNLGVTGFDSDMRRVQSAYNSRQIDASSAIQLVGQLWANYWALVTPHIQAGRNGCQGGASCPPWPASGNGCSGSIGASCCVGCYDLAGDTNAKVFQPIDGGDGRTMMFYGLHGTIAVLQHGGGLVLYPTVYGSKYGGKQRQGYTLAWVQTSAA